MEELGIGRPSTYASTLAVLQDRDYVRIDKKRLIPEDKGRLVTAFLESFFKRYVEYDFTADLEEKLDLISDGKLEWKDVLRDFWRDFTGAVDEIKDLRVGEVLEALNEILGPHIFPPKAEGGDPRQCPNCGEGRLSLKVGKFGAFIGCSQLSRLPLHAPVLRQPATAPAEASTPDGKLLGHDPETGLPVTLRTGRFGPYVQLGEAEGEEKPKRSSHAQGRRRRHRSTWSARCSCCRCRARSACIRRPASRSRPASAATGRSSCTTAPTPTSTRRGGVHVGINRAVVLLAEKKAGGGKGRFQRAAPTVLKELGEHPERRRQGAGAVGALRPLRQARRRQRHAAARQGARGADHGRGRAADRRARRQGPVQSQEAARQASAKKAKADASRRAARRKRRQGQAKAEVGQGRSRRPARRQRSCGVGRSGRTVRPQTASQKPASARACPSKEEILDYHAQPLRAKAGKREIARAFAIKGGDRVALKALLAEMADEGLLAGNRKGFKERGQPAARRRAGDRRPRRRRRADRRARRLGCSEGERPRVLVLAPRAGAAGGEPALGQGDRILARITRLEDDGRRSATATRRSPSSACRARSAACSASSAPRRDGGGIIDPVDRKELKEWPIAAGDEGDAKDGDLVRFDLAARASLRRAAGARRRDARQPAGPAQDQPDRRARARHPRRVSRMPCWPRSRRSSRRRSPAAPTCATCRSLTIDPVDARDHDDAVHAAPDDDPEQRRRLDRARRHRRRRRTTCGPARALDREAQLRGNSVYFPDRVVPMLPERISNDLCSLREGEERALPRRAHGLRQARQQDAATPSCAP